MANLASIPTLLEDALAAHARAQLARAEALYREVLAREPRHAVALHMLGVLALQCGHPADAVTLIEQAAKLRPGVAKIHVNLGLARGAAGDRAGAIQSFERALALSNDPAERAVIYSNLAGALTANGKLDEAAEQCRLALELDPGNADACNNLGDVLRQRGDLTAATAQFERALAQRPGMEIAECNLACTLLAAGAMKRGLELYEQRGRWPSFPPTRADLPAERRWHGDMNALRGRTILLYAEQGFGDSICFVRYAPLLAERGAKVIVDSPPELAELLRSVAGVERVVCGGIEGLPAFDLFCPLPSLPRAFDTTLETIPADVPYLHANARMKERWAETLAADERRLKVGLAWAGRTYPTGRSLPPEILAPALAEFTDFGFYALQPTQTPPAELEALRLIDHTAELRDFAATAALLANLDLVITVDTAVAHLAGALGKPVWTMLSSAPDWRWLLGRADSPWYPTMRLFRQSAAGDWKSAVSAVARALQAFLQ